MTCCKGATLNRAKDVLTLQVEYPLMLPLILFLFLYQNLIKETGHLETVTEVTGLFIYFFKYCTVNCIMYL